MNRGPLPFSFFPSFLDRPLELTLTYKPPAAGRGLGIISVERPQWISQIMLRFVTIKQNKLNLNNPQTGEPWENLSRQNQGLFQLKGTLPVLSLGHGPQSLVL